MAELPASVVIPTYNKKERLLLTLESLNYQSVDEGSFEVVVVDDGSIDGTKDAVKSFKPMFSFKYIYKENSGRSAARNRGVEAAEGGLIIFCDDDILVPKEFVASHLKEYKTGTLKVVHGKIFNLPYLKFFKNPKTGELYPGIDTDGANMEFSKRYLIKNEDIISMENVEKQRKETFFEKTVYSVFSKGIRDMQWLGLTGGNSSCPKELIERVGMFDENFGKTWGCEDLELGYRIYKEGAEFVYSEKACNYHMAHYRMTFKEDLLNTVGKFYIKHQDVRIKYLDKLLLGEIRDVEKYINFINEEVKENVF